MPTINREKVIQTINRDLKKMEGAELRAVALVAHHMVKDKWRLKAGEQKTEGEHSASRFPYQEA